MQTAGQARKDAAVDSGLVKLNVFISFEYLTLFLCLLVPLTSQNLALQKVVCYPDFIFGRLFKTFFGLEY